MNAPMVTLKKRPIDWFLVIVDIERRGYTHSTISMGTGCSRSAIGGWRNCEHEPSHENGEALIELWMAVTSKLRDELPRRLEMGFSAARAR